MSVVLWTVLSLSLTGSALALILLALKPALRFRFSRVWQYYIWLVVLARLLLPFSPEVNLVNAMVKGVSPAQASVPTPASGVEPGSHQGPADPDEVFAIDPRDSHLPAAEPVDMEAPSAASPVRRDRVVEWAGYLWAAVALLLFGRKVGAYAELVREVRRSSAPCVDSGAVLQMDTLCKSMGIAPAPALCVSDAVPSPMLIGILRQQVVLPADAVGQGDLQYVLRHELVHYKRLDILYKWLAQLAACAHWFNPLVHLVRREITRSCELACDEAVLRGVGEEGRRDYGEAILSAIKPDKALAHTGVSVSMSEDTKIIKERLDAIMKFKKPSVWVICLSSVLTAVLLCGAAFAGVYTAEAAPSLTPIAIQNQSNDANLSDYSAYQAFGITADTSGSREVLFYNGERVRLLVDYKENHAFRLFFADGAGSADLLVVRNAQGAVSGITEMSPGQAQEFLNELGIGGNGAAPPSFSTVSTPVPEGRISKEDLPYALQSWTAEVDQEQAGIFAAVYDDRFFVYCSSVPGQFAWQPAYGDNTTISLHDLGPTGDGYALLNVPLCDTLTVTYGNATGVFTPKTAVTVRPASPAAAGTSYDIYKPYGLVYHPDQDKLLYNGQVVRYFVDRYNNGQGIRVMWAYDMDGVVDVHAVRGAVGQRGELTGVVPYSDEDYRRRTLEIEAQRDNTPDVDVLTFRFTKAEAPEHLSLWIQECEASPLDFQVTDRGGRYYVYVRGDAGFGFSGSVGDGNTSMNMEIYPIDGQQGDGYALFSAPLYSHFVVSYNGQTKSFVR